MTFLMLSDLHLGAQGAIEMFQKQIKALCSKIRRDVKPEEKIIIIVLGDVIEKGDRNALMAAITCFDYIKKELSGYSLSFEFVPGNHDLSSETLSDFDSFISRYTSNTEYEKNSVYSREYEGINFIFADSNLTRKHDMPGKVDINEIKKAVKPGKNFLFCHHGFTHNMGGTHDTVENGDLVLHEIQKAGVNFVFHGHTHRSDVTNELAGGIVEIGCGTISKILKDMGAIPNQFAVGYINDFKDLKVERIVVSEDTGEVFAKAQLYPEERTFSDPKSIRDKKMYDLPNGYISRNLLPHSSAIGSEFARYLAKEKEVKLRDVLVREEKILLLSDAGKGKSVELQKLAYDMCRENYFPYIVKLRNYSGERIEELLPEEYNSLSDTYLVLLFDGYDELQEEKRSIFIQTFEKYIERHIRIRVVISSRSNFCKIEENDKSRTFKGFTIYDICDLTSNDINNYVLSKDIKTEDFLSKAKKSKVYDLLKNPFYLVEICELYKKNNDLPSRVNLMDKLIEASFNFDEEKFLNNIGEYYSKLMNRLQRIAFAMQLMQQSDLKDREEYQELFSGDEGYKLIECSGLFVKEGKNWRFVHNNFREYLTAKVLSKLCKEEVINYISNDAGINPSWVNTLSYLAGMNLNWDIVDWLCNNSPSALIKFESDRIDSSMRYQVSKNVFITFEKKQLRIEDELFDIEDFANFSNSEKFLIFILDRIANPQNDISQYNAINVLREFDELFKKQSEIRNVLMRCCMQNIENKSHISRLAVLAILQLGLDCEDIAKKLIPVLNKSKNDYGRLGLYEYLCESNRHNEYVECFLDGIPYISRDDNSDRVFNEQHMLIEGLKAMSTVDSVSSVMQWFATSERKAFFDSEEVFKVLCNKAVLLYNENTSKKLYLIMVENCQKFLRVYEHDNIQNCISFFEKTNTIHEAVKSIVIYFNDDSHYLGDLLQFNDERIRVVLNEYKEERYNNHKVFEEIVRRYVFEDYFYDECAETIKKRTGKMIAKREPHIDYQKERAIGIQTFFDSLFCKTSAEKILLELLDKIGDRELLIGELRKQHIQEWYSAIKHLKVAIGTYGDDAWKVKDFFNKINFEQFAVRKIHMLLESKTGVSISEQQKEWIFNNTSQNIENNILKKEITLENGNVQITKFAYSLLWLAVYFDFSFNQEKMLDMTIVPYYYFGSMQENSKYKYLRKHIVESKLIARIEYNLSQTNLGKELLRDHLMFCKEIQSDVASTKALAVCRATISDDWLCYTAADYLYCLYGGEYVCENILPYVKSNLLIYIAQTYKEISRIKLRERAERVFLEEPSVELMRILIPLDSKQAIKVCVKEIVHRRNQITELREYIEMVSTIKNPERLKFLYKLLKIVLNPNFVDAKYFGLRTALSRAFSACGKINPSKTIKTIKKALRISRDSERKSFCYYMIEDVRRSKMQQGDRARTMEEVKRILKEI